MQIEPVNNTNFKAGKIRLKNLDSVELPNQKVLEKLALDNEIDFLIGTHALISDKVSWNNLGLVITDEQHRFGVNQRLKLKKKRKYITK